jgi:hypothetical protein
MTNDAPNDEPPLDMARVRRTIETWLCDRTMDPLDRDVLLTLLPTTEGEARAIEVLLKIGDDDNLIPEARDYAQSKVDAESEGSEARERAHDVLMWMFELQLNYEGMGLGRR